MIPAHVRRARWGVILCFWLNGVAWSTLLPRFPEIKRGLEIGDFAWGVIIAAGPIAGLFFGMFAARLIRRFQSAGVAVVTQTLGILCLNLLANAANVWVFALGVVLMMSFDSLCDIAMNSHGLRVQREYRRSILNGFHAWWSVGAVSGGLIGSVAAQWHVAIWLQALVASLVFGSMALVARHWMLDGPDPLPEQTDEERSRKFIPTPLLLRLIALGLLGGAAGLVEDSGASWGSVYMERMFDVPPFVWGLAFVSLQAAQMIGRFTGDRLVDRIGQHRAVVTGLTLATIGMGLAVALPTPATTLIGFAFAGWGIATVIPGAMHAGEHMPGLPHGTGLTVTTSIMRVGFLSGPPLIGAVASVVDIRWALIVVPVAAGIGLLLTPAMRPARRS